jgi:glycosyltransferase involved in cell wall biosynthesis
VTPSAPRRIVHVCPRYAPAYGGAELFFEKLTQHLVARGDAAEVWTTNAWDVAAFTRRGARLVPPVGQATGVRVRRFPVRYVPGRAPVLTVANALPLGRAWSAMTPRWGPFVPAMLRAARRPTAPIDIVHAAALPYSSLLYCGWRLARSAGSRLVITPFLHPGRPGPDGARHRRAYLSPVNQWLLAQADLVFVQTESERRTLAEIGIAPERLRLAGMGVDPADCTGGDRTRGRARLGIDPDEVVVGHLANKSADKGTLDLVAAARLLWAEGARFRLVLAGASMPDYRRALPPDALPSPVIDVGEFDADARRDFYAALDVFALPSVVESFGIVLMEAAANGVPSIAYATGGPAEILHHDRTGLLSPPGDVRQLANALRRLVLDGRLRERLGAEARSSSARWTWARSTGVVLEAYDQLLA